MYQIVFDTVAYFIYHHLLFPLTFGRQYIPKLFFFFPALLTFFFLLVPLFFLTSGGLKPWPIFFHWFPSLSSLFCFPVHIVPLHPCTQPGLEMMLALK